MKTLTGNHESIRKVDYYWIALNLKTKEYIQIKNAGCQAVAETMAEKYFNAEQGLYSPKDIKIFFQNTNKEICLPVIPVKYHKYFKSK